MLWSKSQFCNSRRHCTSCPYVLEWDQAYANGTHSTQMEEEVLLSDYFEAEPSGECPHGITLRQAATIRERHKIERLRNGRKRVLRPLLRYAVEHMGLVDVRPLLVEIVGDSLSPAWLMVEMVKEAEAAGHAPAGSYTTVAHECVEELSTDAGANRMYWELRRCVISEALTVAEANNLAEAFDITEPDYV